MVIVADLFSHQPLQFGFAWLFLSVVLALHVVDEAVTDFLAVYNPAVVALRKRFPLLPLPTFTFPVWLGGLCLGIAVAFALSYLAFRGSRVAIVVAYPVSFLMFANGVGHLAASLYRRRFMPGVYSSPFLVAASAYLFYCAEAVRHVS